MRGKHEVYHRNTTNLRKTTNVRKRIRHRRRVQRIKQLTFCLGMAGMACISIGAAGKIKELGEEYVTEEEAQNIGGEVQTYSAADIDAQQAGNTAEVQKVNVDNSAGWEDTQELLEKNGKETEDDLDKLEDCPEELQELLEKYPETYDFVMGYSERSKYQGKEIDLSEDVEEGEVPLLLQWDKRWGYDSYGSKFIGAAGCGPTCMSMAYIYLTGDTDMNPREMAEFADRNGYNAKAGTKWDFFTDGAATLGLQGREMKMGEEGMKTVLDKGKVIICSMSPGDFTKGGHFILIRGYDEEGFLVNDPNSRINSEKHWDYETLSYQIKNMWSIGAKNS